MSGFYGYHTRLPDRRGDDIKTLRSLLPYLWRYRGRVAFALLALVLAKAATVAVPLALKEIVDALDASKQRDLGLPIVFLIAYGLLRLASSGFNELRDSMFARVRHGAMRNMSQKAVDHLHRLSLRFHLERKTGAITRDLERGTRSVSSLLNYMVFNVLPTLIEVGLIATVLLINYSPWFAIITFITVIVYVAFTMKITEWRMRYRVTMNQMDSKANSIAVDSLINYETVKYFGNECYELRRYDDTLSRWEDAAVKSQTSLSALNVTQGGIIAVGVTLIMTLAAQGVAAGTMSLGDLVLVNAFMIQMFIPLNFLGVVYSQLKHALSDMDRMFELLEAAPEVRDAPGGPPLEVGSGAVRFEHVSFGYEPSRTVLHDVDFEIPPGHKVAVVGPSGAGKSTLARLLFRFYDVTGGRVLINGQDVRYVAQQSLRKAIGIVPQDTVLFNETLYHNIAYGDPAASRKDVMRAARLAHIHEFIESLPQGYETLVGERGLKLSGGEKQRVAIARTILKNPSILVFDEATSSLDSASEQAILCALEEIAVDRTTLVIAHRLSTIVDADTILVMEHGRIVERGAHRRLLAKNGVYARLWELQQEERRRREELKQETIQLANP
ncbi:MAG: ABC transporter ATP-binding protein/permease [Gammaproteobacteria bacterium]|nr:ABC transporter ATP-binding protein/permease [Gammaproteobacteria bacterium]NIR97806.1 ABC transporter ATP-binding protein/permease [Gammaproteobacteria bacterium]NIT63506.1 ABC transporter ATP-binding protein/permease [Gammaproteobacteria bacterium]NIV20453.1 ATP-binding cassette domain-containing protein [Gammaproteobacteria bacterium]NIX11035.1 ATP-binding cassette domain-containing protein [Gammaproteobacteria bacterium]